MRGSVGRNVGQFGEVGKRKEKGGVTIWNPDSPDPVPSPPPPPPPPLLQLSRSQLLRPCVFWPQCAFSLFKLLVECTLCRISERNYLHWNYSKLDRNLMRLKLHLKHRRTFGFSLLRRNNSKDTKLLASLIFAHFGVFSAERMALPNALKNFVHILLSW